MWSRKKEGEKEKEERRQGESQKGGKGRGGQGHGGEEGDEISVSDTLLSKVCVLPSSMSSSYRSCS